MLDEQVLRELRWRGFMAALQLTVAILVIVFVAKSVIYWAFVYYSTAYRPRCVGCAWCECVEKCDIVWKSVNFY